MRERTRRRAAPLPDLPREGRGYSREYLIAELRLWAAHHGGEPPRFGDWNRAHARRHGICFELGWPSTQAVSNCFGSWQEGINAACLEPRRVGTPTVYGPDCVNCGQVKRGRGYGKRCSRCTSYLSRNGVEWTEQRAAEGKRRASQRAAEAFTERARDFIGLRRQGFGNAEIASLCDTDVAAVTRTLSRAKARGWEVPRAPYHERGTIAMSNGARR